ncbi:hypothetical protein [Amycolatopsis sp. H20-H5]|uniref:hypothetical protein n=1 Tax=Amycolatopsis sp. H20-H5 TaxID=3046309 RepID=UPI002DBF3FA8|nr:hypothetical protein [Amycolatopsis sp. H20-H5]MEC3977157.1 hypothetical protein [Amycolatopsis sp. H20-H5]
MATWTVTTDTGHHTGTATTPADAWNAAHDAATDLVRDHVPTLITLTVDGDTSTLRPGDSGNHAADLAATLDAIDTGRDALAAAHRERA